MGLLVGYDSSYFKLYYIPLIHIKVTCDELSIEISKVRFLDYGFITN